MGASCQSNGGIANGKGAPGARVAAVAVGTERKLEIGHQWQKLASSSPAPLKVKGKPPQEWIAAKQAHSKSIKNWLQTLTSSEEVYAKALKKGLPSPNK
jgi:hypothetical protein